MVLNDLSGHTESKSEAKLNYRPLEGFQTINICIIIGFPWYVSNTNLLNDLHIPTHKKLAHQY